MLFQGGFVNLKQKIILFIWLEWTTMWMISANALVLSSFSCYASSTQGISGGKHLGRSEMVQQIYEKTLLSLAQKIWEQSVTTDQDKLDIQ